MSAEARASRRVLAGIVLAGVALRALLLALAENRLDADEATVGTMALDVLDGGPYPFFFHRNAYNGGGAMEAYLGALGFSVLGPHPWVLKTCLLAIWTATAFLLAGLVRRALRPAEALLSTFLFALGTPFFLEWSLKARGGYAETVLFGVLLCWLAHPPPALARSPRAAAALFGTAAGIGLWASEMLLPMVALAGAWMLARLPGRERRRALAALGVGLALGLVPLLVYNLTHDWRHLRASVLFALFRPAESRALSLGELLFSLRFVLGPGFVLAAPLALLALFRLAGRRPFGLGHLFLVHTALFLTAYSLSGMRASLPIPASRVLYPLHPGVAVLLACALATAAGSAPRWARAAGAAGLLAWTALCAHPLVGWLASREPREAGSWRGGWALADGADLYRRLESAGTQVVYGSYWTVWQLDFAIRAARRVDPEAPQVHAAWQIPAHLPPGLRAAFVLHPDAPDLAQVESALRDAGIAFEREERGGLVVLHGIDSEGVGRRIGLPDTLLENAVAPPPAEPDGFN